MKKLLLVLVIIYSIVSGQTQNKFLIGAEHVSAMGHFDSSPNPIPGSAFWDTVKSFGLTHAGLLYFQQYSENGTNLGGNWTIENIRQVLNDAAAESIKVFLYNGMTRYPNWEEKPLKRWVYQAEGNYDFNTSLGLNYLDLSAETHWTVADSNNIDNYLSRQINTHTADTILNNLKQPDLQPDYCNYFLKIRMKLRNSPSGQNLKVLSIRVFQPSTGISKTGVVFENSLSLNWSTTQVLTYYKDADGPGDPIAESIDTLDKCEKYKFLTDDYSESSISSITSYNISVLWHGLADCDIDYIAIDNKEGNKLFTGQYDNRITDFVNNYSSYNAEYFKVIDEPYPSQLFPTRYISDKINSALGSQAGTKFPFSYHCFYSPTKRYLVESQAPKLISDYYPLEYNSVKPMRAGYLADVQNRFDYLNYYLESSITSAKQFSKPFIFTVQAHRWDDPRPGANHYQYTREPSAYEIKVMANLAVCRGAKGIKYYMFQIPCGTDTTYYTGLLNNQSISNPLPRYYDEYGYPKWETLKQLNQKLSTIGDDLMSLTWQKSYSIHLNQPPSNEFITQVSSYYINSAELLIPDASSQTYVELGEFKKTNEISNNLLDYFYVVNRRTLPEENRTIKITINKTSYSYKNWIVKEMGTTNSWVVSDTGTFQTTYTPGEGKLFRLEPVMISGGTLGFNENIPVNTTLQVQGNVTVPTGKTLTIGAGSALNFLEASKLSVSGTLNINGTSTNSVALTFNPSTTQNDLLKGVSINQGGIGNIYFAEISNADIGIYAYRSSSLIVENSEITSCDDGIYISGGEASNQPNDQNHEITNNNIHDNTSNGISLYNASPLITYNTITGSVNGVRCVNSSNASLGRNGIEGANNISNVDYGIYSYSSDPFLGYYEEPQIELGGFNGIIGTEYNAWVEMFSTVCAHLNWWGSEKPKEGEFLMLDEGYIDYSYYLEGSPFTESLSPKKENELAGEMSTENNPIEGITGTKGKYMNALKSYFNKNNKEARRICNSILDEEEFSTLKYSALRLLINAIDEDSAKANAVNKIKRNLLTTTANDFNAYLEMTLNSLEGKDYLTTLDGIIAKYPESKYKPLMLFKKFNYVYFEMDNKDSAKVISDIMNSLYPDNQLTIHTKRFFENTGFKKSVTVKENVIPKDYQLFQNYPNPFNPETVISYQLPKTGNVKLELFTILGEKITTLIDENKEAGTYDYHLSASKYKLTSGIYIVRMLSDDYSKSIKMNLIK